MSIGPPTGMRDWLPQDALLRQHLMETIGKVYRLYGYLPIDTPVMEDLSVLLGKGGGENEKLLFKILKRGEKLAEATVEDAEQAVLLQEAPDHAVPQGAGPEGEGREVEAAEQGAGADEE